MIQYHLFTLYAGSPASLAATSASEFPEAYIPTHTLYHHAILASWTLLTQSFATSNALTVPSLVLSNLAFVAWIWDHQLQEATLDTLNLYSPQHTHTQLY